MQVDQSEQERCHHRGAGAKKRKATSQKGCLSSKAPLSTRHSIPYTYLDILFLFAISQRDFYQHNKSDMQNNKFSVHLLTTGKNSFHYIAYVFHCLPLPSSTISHYSLAFLGHICLFTLDIYLQSNSSFVYILQNVTF